MERTILSWNIANWVTVMLMAAAGYAVIGLVSQFLLNRSGMQATGGGF